MTEQLKIWQSDFGDAYTDRNPGDWRKRNAAFQVMLEGLSIGSVLEVGCNRGQNLIVMSELLGDRCELAGVEPNEYALGIAKASARNSRIVQGDAFDLEFKDGYFDLVMTACVLIHVSLSDLPRALNEIYRVSSHYLLAIEYFAEEETVIQYRDHNNLLWKRDFLGHYQTQFPDLDLVRQGYWGPEDGFDRTHWWLLEKSGMREQP